MAKDWKPLGTKADLASLLRDTTRIPVEVLTFEIDLADISVACRMSWAASRQTTRVEDEAYSLLGIFGVNIPTVYGEGRKAFYRLQEEIMKTSADTSLFAWGRYKCGYNLNTLQDELQVLDRNVLKPQHCLFASSPLEFADCDSITFDGQTTALAVSFSDNSFGQTIQHF